VISKRQYQILNACADDWEVFYFPFAMVNFGGQVFRRADGPGYAQYDDSRRWQTTVDASEIVNDIRALVSEGLLACHRVLADGTRHAVVDVRGDDFGVYKAYRCLTFDEHVERHGYGPHEFKVTVRGLHEIENDRYRSYDQELGWS
jgi:hypothetical protein